MFRLLSIPALAAAALALLHRNARRLQPIPLPIEDKSRPRRRVHAAADLTGGPKRRRRTRAV